MRRRFLESEDDVILNSIYELTHGYDGEGNLVPTFFDIHEITDNYGLQEDEIIDIAKNNGYNVYRIPGGEDLVNFTIIAHEDLSYGDVIKGTDVDIKEIGDDTDDSFNMGEDYMTNTKDMHERLKRETNNFTKKSDILRFDSSDDQISARNILLKHYIDVETFSNDSDYGISYFVEYDNPKKQGKVVKEEKQHIDTTVRNALAAVSNYRYKYGNLDWALELQARFHLLNWEMLWILDKCLEKGIIDDGEKQDVIKYLNLEEDVKYNKFKEDDIERYVNKYHSKYPDISIDDIEKVVRKHWGYTHLVDDIEKNIEQELNSMSNKNESLNEINKKDESLKEELKEEVVEETNEYKIIKTTQHNFRTINGVAKKGKDKVIYQVYFRTQDFNPSVNRWMNRGWSLQLTDFKTLEDARAYVKKYGKELKSELEFVNNTLNEELGDDYSNIPLVKNFNFVNKKSNHLPGIIDIKGFINALNEIGYDEFKCRTTQFGKNISYNDLRDSWLDISRSGWSIGRTWDTSMDGFNEIYLCTKKSIKEDLEEDIEKHDELNPKLFDGDELKSEIKDKIEQIAYQFVRELNDDGIKFTLKDIVLLGSNVSYNYTKDSDLDIHLIADSSGLECPDGLYDKLYSAYRSIFNRNYDITIKGIPAEIFVEMDDTNANSNGIYSINNGWIKHPEQTSIPDLDKEAFDKLFNEWEDRYIDLIGNEEDKLEEELSDDIKQFIQDLYQLRKDSIASDGEYGIGNLVFKEFRNRGYLDSLKKLRKIEKSKELSLEQLDEELKKNNASKLFQLLKTDVKELNVIISADTNNTSIKETETYKKAEKEIEKGLSVEGMWFNPDTHKAEPQPNSTIIKCDLEHAKELAGALGQKEFITVEFSTEDSFDSHVYAIDEQDNNYKDVESSSEVVFDKDAKKLPYYSILDGVAFSLGLYGNKFGLDEGKKMRRKDKYYVVNANCGDWYSSLLKAISEVKRGLFGDEHTMLYTLENLDDPMNVSELGIDDLLMEFENCKVVKDYRKH